MVSIWVQACLRFGCAVSARRKNAVGLGTDLSASFPWGEDKNHAVGWLECVTTLSGGKQSRVDMLRGNRRETKRISSLDGGGRRDLDSSFGVYSERSGCQVREQLLEAIDEMRRYWLLLQQLLRLRPSHLRMC